MELWLRDLTLAARRLRRNPMPTTVIVVTLAIGIGACAAIFSVFSALIIRPLPFRDADRLVRLRETEQRPGQPARETVVSARNFELWWQRTSEFAEMAAARYRTLNVSGDGEPQRLVGVAATWNHFRVLGAEPLIGRVLEPDDERPGSPAPVAVIAHSLWASRFGQDPRVIGRQLLINGRGHTIVGVMRPGFRYPYGAELWLPLAIDPAAPDYDQRRLNVTARLAPDATAASALAELEALARQLRHELPEVNARRSAGLRPIRDEILEGVDRQVAALLSGATFLLLIAAANVASMMLGRWHSRQRETAVRLALGASRVHLCREVITECLLLSLGGCTLGLLMAAWTTGPLAGMSPIDDLGPYFRDIYVDVPVVAFAFAAALAVSLLFGLPAIFYSSRRSSQPALRSRRANLARGQRRTFDSLVVAEVAIAMVLLTGAGLMAKSLSGLWATRTGVVEENLWTFSFSPALAGYETPPARLAFLEDVLDRVRALPGVEAASITNLNPFRDQGWGARVWPEGRDRIDETERVLVNHRAVLPGFFETAGTRILAGRSITEADESGAPGVAIVSRRLAEALWPGNDPVGKRIRPDLPDSDEEWVTVVGVAEDVADYGDLTETWYRPYAQDPSEFTTAVLELFVRVSGEPTAAVGRVREAIRGLDPDLPVFDIEPMSQVLRFERRTQTFTTVLLSLFAALGLLLAAVGAYGVMSYVVSRRTAELGLRMALGAESPVIFRQLVGGSLVLTALGLAIGMAAAYGLTRFLESFLFEVNPLDPAVFAAMAVGTVLVEAGAAALPAWKATRVDPMDCLRGE